MNRKGGSRHLCCCRDASSSEGFLLTVYLDFRAATCTYRSFFAICLWVSISITSQIFISLVYMFTIPKCKCMKLCSWGKTDKIAFSLLASGLLCQAIGPWEFPMAAAGLSSCDFSWPLSPKVYLTDSRNV